MTAFRREPFALGTTSGIFGGLRREWDRVAALASSTRAVARWQRTCPALAAAGPPGGTTPQDLVDALDAADFETRDAMLVQLVTSFQDGHQLAGQVVLHAMLPKLAQIARRARWDGSTELPPGTPVEELRHVTVAEFWHVLAAYPVRRRPTRIAANLAFDTLHRVSGAYRRTGTVVAAGTAADLAELRERTEGGSVHVQCGTPGTVSAESTLTDVLVWALHREVLTVADAQVIVDVYLTGPDGARVPDAVRQRCSRIGRRLRAAVAAEMAPVADVA